MSFNKDELESLWDCCFETKVFCEDEIELEKAGIRTGFKKGYIESKLKEAEKCLVVIARELAK